jgi:hypothetical protein
MKPNGILVGVATLLLALTGFSADPVPDSSAQNWQAIFNAIYPDLATHQDIVTAAMMSLTAEGFQAPKLSAVMDAVATRARSNLQHANDASGPASPIDSTTFATQEKAARAEAERLYPEVDTPGSPLSERISAEKTKLGSIYPDYFKNPQWPLMLTNGCIAVMMLESQENKAAMQAEQQAQANQSTMSIEQAKQAVELLQMLKDLKRGQR